MVDRDDLERAALTPQPVDPEGFNTNVSLPYGLTTEHVRAAMEEFADFLGFINRQLHTKGIQRQETMMDPAGFSGMLGGFMVSGIPRYCPTLAKNNYHHGHPDMLPAGYYLDDSAHYVHDGIEVKASRRTSGWEGHNPENVWLMVFVYDSNKPSHIVDCVPPRPFRFVRVLGAQVEEADWRFSGREGASRRTITAAINRSGLRKLRANWIYEAPAEHAGLFR